MRRIEKSIVEEWKQIYDANFFSALALVGEDSLNPSRQLC
jgi:hypothetical protein